MGLHIQTCSPSQGWDWLTTGLRIVKQRPADMLMIGSGYLFITLFPVVLLSYFGQSLVPVFLPGLTVGLMLAGRMGLRGLKVTPSVLFEGFLCEGKQHLQKLLVLGAFYAVGFAIVRLIPTLFLETPPMDSVNMETQEIPMEVLDYIVSSTLMTTILSAPLVLLFWFAPVLVVWHGMSPAKALFASGLAVWRNKGAFVIYGMGWTVLVIGFTSMVVFVLTALGFGGGAVSALGIFVVGAVMTVTVSTYYPTYAAIFESDPQHLDITIE